VKLYLVRHGQSTGNIGGTLMGQSDHRLTALGEDQARAAAERLAPYGPMAVFSSDLPRARMTAERIAAGWRDGAPGAPHVVFDTRLREISLGDYEGRPWQEFEADTELTASFAEDPYGTALPNGESLRDLEARVHAAVVDILEPFGVDDSGNSCASAVSHGDASAKDRNAEVDAAAAELEAMRIGAARAALDAESAAEAVAVLESAAAAVAADDDVEPDEGLPETMDASAVASGFLQLEETGSACLVAHDGPIRAILNHYLGVPPEKWWTLSTTHGGVSLIEFAGGCVTIRYVNATGHLDGLEADRYVPSDE
jgi:glucosyl-3-phosphoglycerate phosphatase